MKEKNSNWLSKNSFWIFIVIFLIAIILLNLVISNIKILNFNFSIVRFLLIALYIILLLICLATIYFIIYYEDDLHGRNKRKIYFYDVIIKKYFKGENN